MDKQKVKQIFEREIQRHSKEIERHRGLAVNSKEQKKKMVKHFHKKFQTILLAKELGFTFCECCGSLISRQIKKDKDDGSNDSLSGNPNRLQGKDDKDEQMLVGEDNHSVEKHFFVEEDTILNYNKFPKGFKKGKCKCGNTYGYWGLNPKYCVGCLDDMEEEDDN